MFQEIRNCFSSLHRRTKIFLTHLGSCNRTGLKRLSSDPDLLISSYDDMGVSNQFWQVFKTIDSNGDGKISTVELSQLLLCLGYEKSKAAKEAHDMVKEMDFNGDGFVDFDEFMVVMNHTDGKTGSYSDGAVKEEEDCLRDAFLIFDSDKNGLISAKELRTVLTNLGCNECTLEDCKRMIKGVDKNGDGFVDFEEFCSMMNSGHTSSSIKV